MKKITVALLIPLFFLFGCEFESDEPVHVASEIEYIHLTSLGDAVVNDIRATPAKINEYFGDFKEYVLKTHPALATQLSDGGMFSIYSGLIAYSMAPYGNSIKMDFEELLAENVMDCDNYAALTYYLFDLAEKSGVDKARFVFVGWNGGAVGNHAQIFAEAGGASLLIDPTYGFAAFSDFNSVASGKPVSKSQIITFAHREELSFQRQQAISALEKGLYLPSDLLYYFEDFEKFKRVLAVGSALWPTPGAVNL